MTQSLARTRRAHWRLRSLQGALSLELFTPYRQRRPAMVTVPPNHQRRTPMVLTRGLQTHTSVAAASSCDGCPPRPSLQAPGPLQRLAGPCATTLRLQHLYTPPAELAYPYPVYLSEVRHIPVPRQCIPRPRCIPHLRRTSLPPCPSARKLCRRAPIVSTRYRTSS